MSDLADKINDGGPAFPCFGPHDHLKGMTLRDWFAGNCLAAVWSTISGEVDEVSEYAYELADSMLKAREKS